MAATTTDDAPGAPEASTSSGVSPYAGFARREWAADPLIPGDWRTLDTADAATLVVRLHTLLPPARALFVKFWPMAVRIMRPRFYPGWLLVEVQAAHPDGGVGLCNLLYGPYGVALLEGASAPIHRLNGLGALVLGDDTAVAAEYLRFFCSVVHGDAGRFLVLEGPDHLTRVSGRDLITLDEEDTHDWTPLDVTRTEEHFVATATILYGTLVARSVFHVERTGTVEMVEDTPIGTLQHPAEAFRLPFRMARTGRPRA